MATIPTAGGRTTIRRPSPFRASGSATPYTSRCHATDIGLTKVHAYVIGWLDAKPNLTRVFDRFPHAHVSIWLSDRPVAWPPARRLDQSEVDQLADALGALPDPASPSRRRLTRVDVHARAKPADNGRGWVRTSDLSRVKGDEEGADPGVNPVDTPDSGDDG
jgi:hypothetical protein